MDNSQKIINKIKRCDKHKSKNKNKIPHNTKLNNLKSNKYFTINVDENSMKKALTKYREKNNTINNINKTHQSNISSTDVSQVYPIKAKLLKNTSFKLDKKLLSYAEPRAKIKEFHKIQPKLIDSFIIDIDNLDSFFEKEDNEKKEISNNKINNDNKINKDIKNNKINKDNKINNDNKNNKDNNVNNNEKEHKNQSNNIDNSKINKKINKEIKNKNAYKKENILINLNNIDSNDNNNINNEVYKDHNDELLLNRYEKVLSNSNTVLNEKKEKSLFDKEDKKKLLYSLNIEDINFEYLLMIEKLNNELIKDLEINKMEIYQNKLSIVKDFIYIFNSECNNNLYNLIDNMILNDSNLKLANNTFNKNKSNNINKKIINNNLFLIIKEYFIEQIIFLYIFLIIKEYFIEQIIFLYIIILITLIKKDKNNFQSGLHNLTFYFHQNIIVFIYIICSNFNINSNDYLNNDKEAIINYEKCINILNENKTWLDKNNYKKYLQTNNKLSKLILINLLTQINSFFNGNNSFENINYKKSLEQSINMLKSYINSFHKRKIKTILKEIKESSSINNILELTKINKIMSHYCEENKNVNQKNNSNENNANEECNIDSFNDSLPKPPFLKPISPKYKYTLVLDLDETLVHYISDNDSSYIQIRPGAEEFIKDLSEFYEIIIFTAALKNYADLVIEGIDPDGVISDRLYRQHTVSVGNANIKDLDKLGRDIKHVIIVDNFLENFSLQPQNGLNILDFEGNEYDEELDYLKKDLIKLVKLNPDDVRHYLKDIQIDMDKRAIYFQKLNSENNYESELINDNNNSEENNNLFSEIISKDTSSTTDNKENNNHNYSDGEENIEDEKI